MGKNSVLASTHKLFYLCFTAVITTINCHNDNTINNSPLISPSVLKRNIQGNNYLDNTQNHQNLQKRSGWLFGGFNNPIDVATDNFQSSFGSTQYQPYSNQFDLSSQSYQPNIPQASDILLANRELPLTPSSTGNVPSLMEFNNISNNESTLDISAIIQTLKKYYNIIKERLILVYKKALEVFKFMMTKIINALKFLKTVPVIGSLVQILEEAFSFIIYLPKKIIAIVTSLLSNKASSLISMRTLGMLASLL